MLRDDTGMDTNVDGEPDSAPIRAVSDALIVPCNRPGPIQEVNTRFSSMRVM